MGVASQELWLFKCFGGFSVRYGDQPPITHFPTKKTGALLAYLVSQPPHRFRRTALVEQFWAHAPPERGRASLSVACTHLRQTLTQFETAPPLLQISPQEIGLNPDVFRADVLEFHSALDLADRVSDSAVQYQLRAQAVDRYTGHFLDGYTDEWVILQSSFLLGRCLDALEWLVQVEEAENDLARLQRWLERILELDPLNLTAMERLTALHIQGGRRLLADQLIREWFERWRRVMGTDPPELVGQRRNIHPSNRARSQKSERLSSTPLIVMNLPPEPDTLFGRSELMAHLLESMHASATRLITLTGIGGIGKTHLALSAAHRYHTQTGIPMVWVSFADLRQPASLWEPLRQAVGLPHAGQAEPQVLHYLEACGPLWLVLDNFETLMPEGVEAVQKLLASLPEVRLLVTSRHPLGCRGEQVLVVPPLALTDATAMFVHRAERAQQRYASLSLSESEVESLCHALEGIPLAIVLACLRLAVLTPAQMLARLEQRWEWLQSESPTLPRSHQHLRTVFETTIETLSAPALDLLQRLACLPVSASAEQIAPIVAPEVPEPVVLNCLEELMSAGLIQRAASGTFTMLNSLRECALSSSNARHHEAVLTRLADWVLVQAHQRQAEAFEARLPNWLAFWDQHHQWAWESLRFLHRRARETECASLVYCLRRYTELRSLPQEVEASLWELWHDTTLEPLWRVRLSIVLIAYLYRHLRIEEAYALAQQAIALAPQPSYEWDWSFALYARCALTLCDWQVWHACIPTLQSLCPHSDPPLHLLLRHLLVFVQPPESQLEWHETSLQIAHTTQDPLLRVLAYQDLIEHLTVCGEYQRALLYIAHALQMVDLLDVGTLAANLLHGECYCLIQMGDLDSAQQSLERFRQIAYRIGGEYRMWYQLMECQFLRWSGHLEQARQQALAIVPEAEARGNRHLAASLLELACHTWIAQADYPRARACAQHARRIRQQEKDPYRLHFIRTLSGYLDALQGEPDAIESLQTCLQFWRSHGWQPWEATTLAYLAEAYALTSDLENARLTLQHALHLNQQMGRTLWVQRCTALADAWGIAPI